MFLQSQIHQGSLAQVMILLYKYRSPNIGCFSQQSLFLFNIHNNKSLPQ